MSGLLPPISRITRFPVLAHSTAMWRPTAVEPVNEISFTRGSSKSTRASVGPSPGTTLRTPGGRPAFSKISASFRPTSEVSSDGLRTKVLPVASANATFLSASTTGKLKGDMPATTPSGRRIARESRPETSEGKTSPCTRRASPAMERSILAAKGTSKWALPNVEPPSPINRSTISLVAASSSSAARCRIFSRRAAGELPQAVLAAYAASIAARMCCSCAMKILANGF